MLKEMEAGHKARVACLQSRIVNGLTVQMLLACTPVPSNSWQLGWHSTQIG